MKNIKSYKLFESNNDDNNCYKMITREDYYSKLEMVIPISVNFLRKIIPDIELNGFDKYIASLVRRNPPIHNRWEFSYMDGTIRSHGKFITLRGNDLRNNKIRVDIKELTEEWYLVNIVREVGGGCFICDQSEGVILCLKSNKIIK